MPPSGTVRKGGGGMPRHRGRPSRSKRVVYASANRPPTTPSTRKVIAKRCRARSPHPRGPELCGRCPTKGGVSMSIDPNFPGLLEGDVTAVKVTDPPLYPGQKGNLVLDPTQPFTIELEWYIDGPFAPIAKAAMGPEWTVRVFVESIGPGPELVLVDTVVSTASGV